MPPPREVEQWLSIAAEDLRAARSNLAQHPPIIADTIFHAQQAVEKAMKALLIAHGIRPPRTHELEDLAQRLMNVEPDLGPDVEKVTYLSSFAWSLRYPPIHDEMPTEADARESLAEASAFVDTARARLLTP